MIYVYYITIIISSKEWFTAAGLGASSLKVYRELYNIHLLDLVDILYNLEIKLLLLLLLLLLLRRQWGRGIGVRC